MVDTNKSKPLSVSSIKSIFAGIIDGVKKTLNEAGIPLPNPKPEVMTESPMEEALEATESAPAVDSQLSLFPKWSLVCKAQWYPYDSEKC